MRYYSVNIFVSVKTGELTLFGSAPKFGEANIESWGKSLVRSCVLARDNVKVHVNVYNMDIHMDLIKRIAHDYVTNSK